MIRPTCFESELLAQAFITFNILMWFSYIGECTPRCRHDHILQTLDLCVWCGVYAAVGSQNGHMREEEERDWGIWEQ